tara:strand:- start:682 stop:1272 length:591 start_codon:yes stop_codon:yes gene_type:complete
MLECKEVCNTYYDLPQTLSSLLENIDINNLSISLAKNIIKKSNDYKLHTEYKLFNRYYSKIKGHNLKTSPPIRKYLKILSMKQQVRVQFLKYLQSIYDNCFINWSNYIIYPQDNGFMGWHTNITTPAMRLYLNYADEDDKSFFRYIHPQTGEMITSYDKKGWQARVFNISRSEPFWHCIRASTPRLSLGFRITKRI